MGNPGGASQVYLFQHMYNIEVISRDNTGMCKTQ
jgi:hypothetical protein